MESIFENDVFWLMEFVVEMLGEEVCCVVCLLVVECEVMLMVMEGLLMMLCCFDFWLKNLIEW